MGGFTRNTGHLADREFDVVIVGGGIFGACAVWDAASRGLSAALIEKNDFAHATSSNSFRMVHGGIRYLQHANFRRVRKSMNERRSFMRIAPHLVYPLPIVVPTYGHGMKGKAILRAGFCLYDFVAFDRNRGIRDRERRIPGGRFISREETLKLFPGLIREGLTGGAIFHDGQIHNPSRLVLSFLRSAVDAGAVAANYMEAVDFIRRPGGIAGVTARDLLTGEEVRIRCKTVLNASGPWAEMMLKGAMGLRLRPGSTYSRDLCFIVPRRFGNYAVAVQGRTKDPDAILSRKKRHLFIVPWRNYTLIGVWHCVHDGRTPDFSVSQEEVRDCIDEINEVYPGIELTPGDVSMWNAGIVLTGDNDPGAKDISYGKQSRLVDHANEHGIEGLVTLIGARFTTAKRDASEAVSLIFNKLGRRAPASAIDETPIYGGRIDRFEEFITHESRRYSHIFGEDVMRSLLHNYGSEYTELIRYVEENPGTAETIGDSGVIKAEVLHAVREEMAQKLGDVVFRRTDLAAGGYPGDDELRYCAEMMAAEKGWDDARIREEITEVKGLLQRVSVSGGNQISGLSASGAGPATSKAL
ncbi:MAG: glycerol-3-phosphate dehydrogenase/oxidase [Nitrospirae bacterium]|nr:glycerol-3-phosphate dehydrogenase/oxidase [Nitrospirota bacterium]